MHFMTSYKFCPVKLECYPILRILFFHHGMGLRTIHLTFCDPFWVYFKGSKRIQGSRCRKEGKSKAIYDVFSRDQLAFSWLISPADESLGMQETFNELDILGFLMDLEWPNLGKYFKRYNLWKGALLHYQDEQFFALYFMLWYLFLLFGLPSLPSAKC